MTAMREGIVRTKQASLKIHPSCTEKRRYITAPLFVFNFNYFVFVFFFGTAASCLFVFTSVVVFLPVAVLCLVFVPCDTLLCG